MPPDSKNPTERLGRELCSTSLRFLPRARAVPLSALALPIVLNEIKQTGSQAPGAAEPDGRAGGGPEDRESRGLREEGSSLRTSLGTGPGPGRAGGGVQPPHPLSPTPTGNLLPLSARV